MALHLLTKLTGLLCERLKVGLQGRFVVTYTIHSIISCIFTLSFIYLINTIVLNPKPSTNVQFEVILTCF